MGCEKCSERRETFPNDVDGPAAARSTSVRLLAIGLSADVLVGACCESSELAVVATDVAVRLRGRGDSGLVNVDDGGGLDGKSRSMALPARFCGCCALPVLAEAALPVELLAADAGDVATAAVAFCDVTLLLELPRLVVRAMGAWGRHSLLVLC